MSHSEQPTRQSLRIPVWGSNWIWALCWGLLFVPQLALADGNEGEALKSRSLITALTDGGLMMIPIVGCSFLLTVFTLERVISLRRARVAPGPFVKRFLHQVREGKIDRHEALELCQESNSSAADLFAAAVRKWGRPAVEVEQAVIDGLDRASNHLRKYLRLLNVIANVSPLLGLLGTVFGMIRLFAGLSQSDVAGRSEILAQGISEALTATAGGLCVAIPALCLYVFFSSRVERLTSDLDELGQEVASCISAEALAENRQTKTSRRSSAA